MRPRWVLAAAISAILGLTGSARALTIKVNVVRGEWTNVVSKAGGTTGITFFDLDGKSGDEEIRWGTSLGSGQSGYRFIGAAPPAIGSLAPGETFVLGEFTHSNFPITGTTLASARLDVYADLTVDGTTLPSQGPFLFSFVHNETPNNGPDPRDIVTLGNVLTSSSFVVGGQTLTLALAGFQVGGSTVSEFFTNEGLSNTASLIGVFRAPTPGPGIVPEPGTLLLLGSGLVGLASRVRSRKRR